MDIPLSSQVGQAADGAGEEKFTLAAHQRSSSRGSFHPQSIA